MIVSTLSFRRRSILVRMPSKIERAFEKLPLLVTGSNSKNIQQTVNSSDIDVLSKQVKPIRYCIVTNI